MRSSWWKRFALVVALLALFAVRGSSGAEGGRTPSKEQGKSGKKDGGKLTGLKKEIQLLRSGRGGYEYDVKLRSQRKAEREAEKVAEEERKAARREEFIQKELEKRDKRRQKRLEREERKRQEGLEAKSSQKAEKLSSSVATSSTQSKPSLASKRPEKTQSRSSSSTLSSISSEVKQGEGGHSGSPPKDFGVSPIKEAQEGSFMGKGIVDIGLTPGGGSSGLGQASHSPPVRHNYSSF